jgi:ethanolamine utilization protein EutA
MGAIMDRSVITSVGIDIGTSTMQVAFARLTLENTAGYFAVPHIAFVDKKLLYKSSARFTPLKTQTALDEEAIRRAVLLEYGNAGFSPSGIDTGAVIITGESARKENAARLLDSLSGLAGEFVVSTVGPDLEAVIAGKGSGAARFSRVNGTRVANMDIGGGTANVAVFEDGEVACMGSFDIGGRLIRVDGGRISYVSESAAKIALSEGLSIEPGDAARLNSLRRLCEAMARLLEQAAGITPPSPLLVEIRTKGSAAFIPPEGVEAICFSGGVADCIRSRESDLFRYGDIGPILGEEILRSRLCAQVRQLPAEETISATVVGAGSHTASVSGSTILHRENILPLKNIAALKLDRAEQDRCYRGDYVFLKERVGWFLRQNDASQLILAMEGEANPSYARLKALAACVYDALDAILPQGAPLLLALERDTARALGQAIEALAGQRRPVICIDAVRIEQGDYVDLGRPMMDGMVIPVIVKTLAFG